MSDLKSKGAIYLKAILFLAIGATSGFLLIVPDFKFEKLVFLALVIWSFCRAYYFAFYVIERYVDSQFRFSGLYDFAKYLIACKGSSRPFENPRGPRLF